VIAFAALQGGNMKKKTIEQIMVFRLMVIGSLTSLTEVPRGRLKSMIREIAARDYAIPGSVNGRTRIAEKTIEGWYYSYLKGGADALSPKVRINRGCSKLSLELQEAIVQAKREQPRRSIDQIIALLKRASRLRRDKMND